MANEVIPIVAAVDDDFRVRESIESLLESAGYEPVVFPSAEEFLRFREAGRSDLCDYRRSNAGNGWYRVTAPHQARASTLPVILISAHYNAEIRKTAIDEGAVDFLYKPFDGTELLKIIQSAVTNAREK